MGDSIGDSFDWGAKVDISSAKTKSTSEIRLIKQLQIDLPTLSQKAWEEVFALVKTEYQRRK